MGKSYCQKHERAYEGECPYCEPAAPPQVPGFVVVAVDPIKRETVYRSAPSPMLTPLEKFKAEYAAPAWLGKDPTPGTASAVTGVIIDEANGLGAVLDDPRVYELPKDFKRQTYAEWKKEVLGEWTPSRGLARLLGPARHEPVSVCSGSPEAPKKREADCPHYGLNAPRYFADGYDALSKPHAVQIAIHRPEDCPSCAKERIKLLLGALQDVVGLASNLMRKAATSTDERLYAQGKLEAAANVLYADKKWPAP